MELAFQFVSVPFLCYGICYLLLKTNIRQGVKFMLLTFLITWVSSGIITLLLTWRLHSDAPFLAVLTSGDAIRQAIAGCLPGTVIAMAFTFRPILRHLSEETTQQ